MLIGDYNDYFSSSNYVDSVIFLSVVSFWDIDYVDFLEFFSKFGFGKYSDFFR